MAQDTKQQEQRFLINGKQMTAAELSAFVVQQAAELEASRKQAADALLAKQAAEKAAEDAKAAKSTTTAFTVRLAKYSTKANARTGAVHPKAGQHKGSVEIYAGGQYACATLFVDQWEAIKAHMAEIDAFVNEHRASLKTLGQAIGTE